MPLAQALKPLGDSGKSVIIPPIYYTTLLKGIKDHIHPFNYGKSMGLIWQFMAHIWPIHGKDMEWL